MRLEGRSILAGKEPRLQAAGPHPSGCAETRSLERTRHSLKAAHLTAEAVAPFVLSLFALRHQLNLWQLETPSS